MKYRLILVILLICLISNILSACGEPEKGEQILYRSMRGFSTMDPQVDQVIEVCFVAMHVFDRLVELDEDGNIYPSLLKAMPSVSSDGLIYNFELKPHIKFSNGYELKSSDVKYTFERMLWPETKGTSTWILDSVKGAEDVKRGKSEELIGFKIINDFSFQIELDKPYAPFVQGLATPYASIFPEKAVKEMGHNWGETVIGTGPFKVAKWNSAKELVLEKNQNYFGKKPKLNKIVSTINVDFTGDLAGYEAGKLDIVEVPADKYYDLKSNTEYKGQFQVIQTFNTRYITLNNQNKILMDSRVRHAISIAIDRQKLCDVILKESAVPAYTFIPKGINGYDENVKIEYNIEKAKSLLKEAGYPNGFTIDYIQPNNDVYFMDFAIQSMLEQIGIKLKMIIANRDEFSKVKSEGRFTMCLANWWADIPDADNFLYNTFYSQLNRSSKYHSQIFDSLADQARKIYDEKKRGDIYKRLDKIICQEDWATIPISHNIQVLLVKSGVKGTHINPITNIPIFWDTYKYR